MPSTRPPAAPQTRASTAPALRSPTFRTLLLSELVSLIGDRLVVVALVALVYEQTRSASAVGILMLLKAVPAVALGSLAGALVSLSAVPNDEGFLFYRSLPGVVASAFAWFAVASAVASAHESSAKALITIGPSATSSAT